MNDRELLEAAAKAAGVDVIAWDGKLIHNTQNAYAIKEWNPLTDDGDALRLAVTLGISVAMYRTGQTHKLRILAVRAFAGPAEASEQAHADPTAATRRAIVRAAAELADSAVDQ